MQHRILDEPVHRFVCTIADTNEWRCDQVTGSTDEIVTIDPETLQPK